MDSCFSRSAQQPALLTIWLCTPQPVSEASTWIVRAEGDSKIWCIGNPFFWSIDWVSTIGSPSLLWRSTCSCDPNVDDLSANPWLDPFGYDEYAEGPRKSLESLLWSFLVTIPPTCMSDLGSSRPAWFFEAACGHFPLWKRNGHGLCIDLEV